MRFKSYNHSRLGHDHSLISPLNCGILLLIQKEAGLTQRDIRGEGERPADIVSSHSTTKIGGKVRYKGSLPCWGSLLERAAPIIISTGCS